MHHTRKLSRFAWVVIGVVVVAIIGIGIFTRGRFFIFERSAARAEYQAVFLTNSQVYFGKIVGTEDGYIKMTNIYYLQAPTEQVSVPIQKPTQSQSFSLVKLGNELHGPTDEMYINRDHILFYEDLRSDSSFVARMKAGK